MQQNLSANAKRLGLVNSSRNFTYLFKRAEKIRGDLDMYEKRIPKDLVKKYGSIQSSIAYTLLKIQKDVMTSNKSISMPSLTALALATGSSLRQAQRTVTKLLKEGLLHLKEWRAFDSETGEILTRELEMNFSGKKVIKKFTVTNGKLRKIINPLAKVKKYIQGNQTKRKEMIEMGTLKSPLAINIINKYYERQPYKEDILREVAPPGDGTVIDNSDWDLDL